jgi:hypothetical protein
MTIFWLRTKTMCRPAAMRHVGFAVAHETTTMD